jgi:menaquinone-dependent protoporphyrinogen oxidase
MKPILLLYATRNGQAKCIAWHIADTLRARGLSAEAHDVRTDPVVLADFSGAILVASVYFGRHEREMIRFVVAHLDDLVHLPAAFISVSLSQAELEDASRSFAAKAAASANVRQVLATFQRETGWAPSWLKPVAGALRYTRYGLFIRALMKFLAGRGGLATDTSRDHEYTNWAELDRFAEEFAEAVTDASKLGALAA